MRTLYLQLESGAAGDMLAAALLELVPDPAASLARLNALGIPGVEIRASRDARGGIAGTLFDVSVHGEHEHEHHDHHEHHGHHHHTGLAEIRERIAALDAPEAVRADVRAVYDLLAEAESKAHGRPVDEIHFHEVGSLDALADIASVCLLLSEIAPDRVVASPPNAGGGTVRCAHGTMPVPAPATARLLEGLPWRGDDPATGELLTPTGAALLRRFVAGWGSAPEMRLLAVGCGLGHRETPGRANLVRAMLGEEAATAPGGPNGRVVELAANLDDMTGEDLAFACERIREAGALDVSLAPLLMKKGRPGHLLLALAAPERADAVAAAILRETSTFGVRRTDCARYELSRSVREADGVRVKRGEGYGAAKEKPEFDDRARAALRARRPIGGQALVEFTVGLMALLLAVVAILVVGALGRGETDAMAEAQARAAERSLGSGIAEDFSPLSDVDPGPDGFSLTADDRPVAGSLGPVRVAVAGGTGLSDAQNAVPEASSPRGDDFGEFAAGGSTSVFGFRSAEASAVAELPPAAGLLGLREPEVEQRAKVWMPMTGGL